MPQQLGKILQEELKKEGAPSLQDFASMIGVSYRTLFNVFKGDTELTFKQAIKASDILHIDLIKKYLHQEKRTFAVAEQYLPYNKTEITLTLHVSGLAENMAVAFPELLQIISKEAENRGLKLT